MRRTTLALLATACLALAGCSAEEPSPGTATTATTSAHPARGKAACRRAIKAQYVPGTVKLKGKPGRPKECDGLSTDEVSSIAESVIEELSK